ncbi:MAG: RnfABCDGE type electron transport complex subunit D [Planctomycetota bacterium]
MTEPSQTSTQAAQKKAPPKPAQKKKKPFFMKQRNMLRVIWCLLAVMLSAIYFFGWRVLLVCAVAVAVGVLVEYITTKQRGRPVSMAVFVTTLLFALSLPPTAPWLVVVVGTVVAILFGKEVFGGFGRNPVNPAILGRAFVYISFPGSMTNRFVPAFGPNLGDLGGSLPYDAGRWYGGFAQWSFTSWAEGLVQRGGLAAEKMQDAISQASPLWVSREYGSEVTRGAVSWWELALGPINGVFTTPDGEARILSGGSMGEGCAVLIALCAIYLIWTRTANWRLTLSAFLGFAFANLLWRRVFGFAAVGPLYVNLLGGTAVYVMVFMVTCPVTAPKQRAAQWAYAGLIGFFIVTLRWLGVFVAAATFSILLGNLLAPLLDMGATEYKKRQAARKTADAGGAS